MHMFFFTWPNIACIEFKEEIRNLKKKQLLKYNRRRINRLYNHAILADFERYRGQQTCYKLIQQLIIVLQFNDFVTVLYVTAL